MRVIAGTLRGHRLYGPRKLALRPTSDRVREALFSILGNRLTNSRFLDLYAGTGAVGIEAVSRDAEHVTSVESNRNALKLLRQNLDLCHIGGDKLAVLGVTVQQFLNRPDEWSGPYDIVFADPPYEEALELPSLFAKSRSDELFALDSWLVIEHAAKNVLPMWLGCTTFLRLYRYGDTALSLYSHSHAVQA
ncbi:MAG: 16S rRNA (guanine(966)-N(2))-methyltransferase RsmD [Nitrospira sp.]|nr:16S rRNA (guanine(966)-N(2))-methyltransferase RsmD [Nitrospira sp.]